MDEELDKLFAEAYHIMCVAGLSVEQVEIIEKTYLRMAWVQINKMFYLKKKAE